MIDSVSCLLLTGAQAFSSLPSDALPRLPFTCEGHTTSYEGETVAGYTSSYETENGVTTCCDQARADGAICGFEVYGSTCVQYLGTRCTLAPASRQLSDTDSPDSASVKNSAAVVDGQAYPITQSNGDFDEAAGAESIAQSNGDFDKGAGASSYRPSPGTIRVSLCPSRPGAWPRRCKASEQAELPKSVMKGQVMQLNAYISKAPAAGPIAIQFTYSACKLSTSSEGGFKEKLTLNFPKYQKNEGLFVKCSSAAPTDGTISAVQVLGEWSYLNFEATGWMVATTQTGSISITNFDGTAITGSTELVQGQAKGFKVALNVPSVGDTTANLVFKEDKADCAFGASAGGLFPASATSLQAKI